MNPVKTIRPHLTIEPASGWAALNVRETWHFRDLLFTLTGRELKLRYKQTALGMIWVVLQPLIAAGVFTFVFGKVAKLDSGGVPYFVFSYAGLLGWNLFNNTVTRSSICLVSNANLISKVYFPRLILPFSTVPGALIDFAVAGVVMTILMIVYKTGMGWGIFLLPLWMAILLMLSLGIGLITSALAVSYRDVQHILPVFMQILLYASPVAYAAALVPVNMRGWYFLNPLASILEAFRWSLLGRGEVNWPYLCYSAVVSLAAMFVGALAFKRMERRFADVI